VVTSFRFTLGGQGQRRYTEVSYSWRNIGAKVIEQPLVVTIHTSKQAILMTQNTNYRETGMPHSDPFAI
jgi:hypothetical protein